MNKREKLVIGLVMSTALFTWGCGDNEKNAQEGKTTEVEMASTEIQTSGNVSELSTEDTTADNSVGENTSTVSEQEYETFEQYSIKLMYVKMSATTRINIRKGPKEDYDKIASLDMNQEIVVTGQCQETGWYRVELDGVTGFVSNEYMSAVEENKIILGDECPYAILVKTTYRGQEGWFFRTDGKHEPEYYEDILAEIKNDGYITENQPVYVGTWRDVGDVMWIGYSK